MKVVFPMAELKVELSIYQRMYSQIHFMQALLMLANRLSSLNKKLQLCISSLIFVLIGELKKDK